LPLGTGDDAHQQIEIVLRLLVGVRVARELELKLIVKIVELT